MKLTHLSENPSIRFSVLGAQRTATETVRICTARLRALRNTAMQPKNGF